MNIEKINEILEREIEYAKMCNMPQFVMGLAQARNALNVEASNEVEAKVNE